MSRGVKNNQQEKKSEADKNKTRVIKERAGRDKNGNKARRLTLYQALELAIPSSSRS
jgi:hypothetical protein